MSPLQRYQADIEGGLLSPDASQAEAIAALNDLYLRLSSAETSFISSFKKVLGLAHNKAPKGLYLWGGVGRGKTYLMDLFFESLPFAEKKRTHFHRFMRRVHAELKTIRDAANPLEIVAARLAKEARVICFDEFFVIDITDAMILANLLRSLFQRGVCLVATSNIEPAGLYKDGLQRARFLPAIALLEEHTEVRNVDGGIDYRLRTLKQAPLYRYPCSEQNKLELAEQFSTLAANSSHCRLDDELEVEGRSIKVLRVCEDLAWFDFYALCDGPRSQNDYIELACEFHTVVVSGIPVLDARREDQARRFVYLVDEFYDRRVKLILEAERHFSELYQGQRLQFEFQRTVSRIQEMQSEEYLASAHREG